MTDLSVQAAMARMLLEQQRERELRHQRRAWAASGQGGSDATSPLYGTRSSDAEPPPSPVALPVGETITLITEGRSGGKLLWSAEASGRRRSGFPGFTPPATAARTSILGYYGATIDHLEVVGRSGAQLALLKGGETILEFGGTRGKHLAPRTIKTGVLIPGTDLSIDCDTDIVSGQVTFELIDQPWQIASDLPSPFDGAWAYATSNTVTLPSGQPGDLMLAVMMANTAGGANITVPSGWTQLATVTSGSARTTSAARVADGSETSASWSTNGGPNTRHIGVLRLHGGVTVEDHSLLTANNGGGSGNRQTHSLDAGSHAICIGLSWTGQFSGTRQVADWVSLVVPPDASIVGSSGGANRKGRGMAVPSDATSFEVELAQGTGTQPLVWSSLVATLTG